MLTSDKVVDGVLADVNTDDTELKELTGTQRKLLTRAIKGYSRQAGEHEVLCVVLSALLTDGHSVDGIRLTVDGYLLLH